MPLSMEDLIDRGFTEEKEKLVICSRTVLNSLCDEFGITNKKRAGNEYSAFVKFMERGDEESASRLLEAWKEDEFTTSLD